MTNAEREELRSDSRANLTGASLREALRLIEENYRDDPDAVRGFIWDELEMEVHDGRAY